MSFCHQNLDRFDSHHSIYQFKFIHSMNKNLIQECQYLIYFCCCFATSKMPFYSHSFTCTLGQRIFHEVSFPPVLLEVDRIDQDSNRGPLGNWDLITAKCRALACRATQTCCFNVEVHYSTELAWCFCVNLSQKLDF